MQTREVRTTEDIEQIIELGYDYASEVRPGFKYDPDRIRFHGKNLLADVERKFMNGWISFDEGGEATGFLIATKRMYLAFDEWVAQDELIYVRKQSRGSSAAFRMLLGFEQWARVGGAIEAYVGTSRFEQTENAKTGKMFNKLGYGLVGSNWRKDLRGDPRQTDPKYARFNKAKEHITQQQAIS